MTDNRKIKSLLGIAKKAGRTVCGTEKVVESIRSGKKSSVKLMVVASDASANTVKRAKNTSAYYGIPTVWSEIGKSELGKTVGSASDISVVGVTDEGFCQAILKAAENE